VKLLGAPIGSEKFTTAFIKKKLVSLQQVCKMLTAVDDAQIELGLFRGCLAYNKINHLLRTCPPYQLRQALRMFDDHFRDMLATILRVPCLGVDTWEHASLPTRFAGLGITQTKTVAGAAFVGSCALTHKLVAGMLGADAACVPPEVIDLLAAHEASTGTPHDFQALCTQPQVQRLLSDQEHKAILTRLKGRSSTRTQNLLRCRTPATGCLLLPSRASA
jgi:hypothetical protein